MTRAILILLVGSGISSAQDSIELPDKAKALKENYEAAVLRATAPLNQTYQKELQKLKDEYTRAGDLRAALAVDSLLMAASPAGGGIGTVDSGQVPLSKMSVEQFKHWLSGVVITEQAGFRNSFTYDGKTVVSTKPDTPSPRIHDNVIIEVGKIFVPFTSTNASIAIDSSLTKARISYSTGSKTDATVTAKTRK